MYKPEVSIVLPSIRPENLNKVYDSILASTKRTFELIVAGPFGLPDRLQNISNVKYVKDIGSPVRASNIASTLAEGKIFKWFSDDSIFYPGALDKTIDLLYNMGDDYKNVVVMKYLEGKNGTDKKLQNDDYFKMNGSDWTRSPYIPNNYWLFNECVMYREFFEELGGWDNRFQATFYSHADMANRAQFLGSKVIMADFPISDCDHEQSDHRPIEIAQVEFDKPLYHSIYNKPDWIMNEMRLDIHSWKDSPIVWDKRFKV